jgi:hypothetical protein
MVNLIQLGKVASGSRARVKCKAQTGQQLGVFVAEVIDHGASYHRYLVRQLDSL